MFKIVHQRKLTVGPSVEGEVLEEFILLTSGQRELSQTFHASFFRKDVIYGDPLSVFITAAAGTTERYRFEICLLCQADRRHQCSQRFFVDTKGTLLEEDGLQEQPI
ncbi:hypothetical protein AK812_SmicGene35258 [Symbiodinium microadriaticum]|uniref:Uncharacterized protein n=1 Tax=Symbiodinium microadriaticum TaxID=2951 RepID=A0A1Q9CLW6_SYMMI|nr:hypothetical protein AK812_SmicGene35258 [Symbiodinium microadriaticum]